MEIFQRSVLKNTTWPLPGEKPTRDRKFISFLVMSSLSFFLKKFCISFFLNCLNVMMGKKWM